MRNHLLKYSTFTEGELTTILSYFETKTFKKREMIISTGSVANYQYFIMNGCVRGYIVDYSGKEYNIIFGFENFWFGDMESFENGVASSYNYQALEPVTLLRISKDNWDKLYEQIPAFTTYKCNLFKNAMIFQQKRIAEHFMQSAEQRYYNLLDTYPDVLQRVSLKNIASYLGISAEFVSILRKKMVQK